CAVSPIPWQVSADETPQVSVKAKYGVPENAVYRSRRPYDILRTLAERQGVLFCDTSPTFVNYQHSEKMFLNKQPRFSEYGNQLYAHVVSEFIAANVPGLWSNSRAPAQPAQPVSTQSPAGSTQVRP